MIRTGVHAARLSLAALGWLALVIVLVTFVVAVFVLLPGKTCVEFNDWHFVRIWPRPSHC